MYFELINSSLEHTHSGRLVSSLHKEFKQVKHELRRKVLGEQED